MSGRMRILLELERILLVLDAEDPAAEALRELMDPLWYGLDDEERRLLNDRAISGYGDRHTIPFELGADLFGPARDLGGTQAEVGPLEFGDWRSAA